MTKNSVLEKKVLGRIGIFCIGWLIIYLLVLWITKDYTYNDNYVKVALIVFPILGSIWITNAITKMFKWTLGLIFFTAVIAAFTFGLSVSISLAYVGGFIFVIGVMSLLLSGVDKKNRQ